MENQRISEDELAQKLVNSRKIMKKVDSGEYEKGNIDGTMLSKAPEELMEEKSPARQSKTAGLPVGVPSVDKIRRSKLPDAIKTAMIETPIPIPELSLTESLDMNLVNKARKLMEEDNGSNKSGTAPKQSYKVNENLNTSVPGNLEMIIENVIRRVLDEKLSQILNAQGGTNLNENLAIKVGDSIFTGKITKVKNTK
jgi:hypothetical protein